MFDFSNKMDALYKSMGKVETNTHANINEILDNLNNLFNYNNVEKSYTKREFVPGNGKRKDYYRIRTYEGVEGKTNTFKGKNPNLLEDKRKEKIAKNNLLNIMTQSFYDDCKNKSETQIIQKYSDNNFVNILNLPYRFKKLFPNLKDSYIYSGKQTLGVHIARHKDVSLPKFQNMQNILNRVECIYDTNDINNNSVNKQKTYAFVYTESDGKKSALMIRPDRYGKLIFWKSIHIVNTKQKKWKKINSSNFRKSLRLVEDAIPSILQTSNASSSRRFSAFTSNYSIQQNTKNTISKAKKEELIKKSGIVEYYLGINKSLNKSNSTSGEGFFYKSQKQITEYWLNYFDELSNELYNIICDYIGLPKANIVSKSVIYKGKILYNPESGKPISKMDLDRLVKVTTKFLNKNRKAGENLVKQSQVLGALLEKLSNTNSASTLKKLGIEDLSIKNVKYETLCENETKASQLLGLDRETFNRIELMKQSAAQHITGIDSKLQNEIQSVLIDGVKNKKNKTQVSEELFKKFGAANRDWKKIADTEIQNNLNESYIRESVKNSKDGEKVYFQRMEVIDDRTCSYCKQMNGTVVMYSSIPLVSDKINDKYASRAIWDGKTWDGDNKTLTNGIFHPSCRGVWVKWKPLD